MNHTCCGRSGESVVTGIIIECCLFVVVQLNS